MRCSAIDGSRTISANLRVHEVSGGIVDLIEENIAYAPYMHKPPVIPAAFKFRFPFFGAKPPSRISGFVEKNTERRLTAC